jgi:hypothetical protein
MKSQPQTNKISWLGSCLRPKSPHMLVFFYDYSTLTAFWRVRHPISPKTPEIRHPKIPGLLYQVMFKTPTPIPCNLLAWYFCTSRAQTFAQIPLMTRPPWPLAPLHGVRRHAAQKGWPHVKRELRPRELNRNLKWTKFRDMICHGNYGDYRGINNGR